MSYRSSTRCFAASLSTNNQSRSPQRHSASHVLPTIKRKRTFSEMDSSGYCPRSEGHGEATNSRRRFWTSAIQLRASDPSLRPLDLAAAIQERFAVNAHPRSIERALRRQTKKKTSLNPAAGACKTAPEILISAYEDLRQAAEGSSPSGMGMAIFVGQVMW